MSIGAIQLFRDFRYFSIQTAYGPVDTDALRSLQDCFDPAHFGPDQCNASLISTIRRTF